MDTEILRMEIAKLELHPGDVLVLKVRGKQTREILEQAKAALEKILPADVTHLVIDDSVDLGVLKKAVA